MSSTKPEIHNILHCRQEDRAMATGNMNRKFRKSGHVVLGICDQTYISYIGYISQTVQNRDIVTMER